MGRVEREAGRVGVWLARRVSGMRVGIVGMGRVGRAVATRAAAFGCPIAYTDLQAMADVPHRFVADLVQLARESDALVLCAAADKAEGIVNAAVLEALEWRVPLYTPPESFQGAGYKMLDSSRFLERTGWRPRIAMSDGVRRILAEEYGG